MSDDLHGGHGCGEAAAAAGWRLADPAWLVNADPAEVWAVLDGAAGREQVLAAAVYRASAHLHRDADAGVRRWLLAMDAARYGDRDLAGRFAAVGVDGDGVPAARWGVTWATGSQVDPRCRYTLAGHIDRVFSVATAVVDGRPVAVTGGDDETMRVWDLATGRPIGEPLAGRTGWVRAIATAVVEGRPVAVTGDKTVRVWDLASGGPVGKPLTGHTV